MTKGTTSRHGRTRPATPKTIDLAASEVKPTSAKPAGEPAPADKPVSPPPNANDPKAATPAAEPVAFGAGDSTRTEAPRSTAPLSGLGATDRVGTEKPSGDAGTTRPESGKTSFGRGSGSGTPKQAPAKSGGGFASSLVSGLVGAVLALILLSGLASADLLRHVPLLGSLAATPSAAPDLSADVAALDKRLASLEAAETTAPANSDGTAISDEMADLASRLSAIESRLNDQPDAGDKPSADLAARIDELAQRIDTVEQRPAATPGTAVALGTRIDTIESQVQSVDTIARATSSRIDELETLVDGMNEKLAAASADNQARAEQDRAARQIAVDALSAAYRRGEPFGDFLDSLRQLSGSSATLDALEPYASSGVATDAELIDGFDNASRQALNALTPEEEGVVSRFLANARSLVDVRPAGPVEGAEPRAVLSRVEADLANGDFGAALAEWQELPAEARNAAADWADKLERRVAADKALRAITVAGTATGQ